MAIKCVLVSFSHDLLSGYPGSLMFKMSGEQGANVTLIDELHLDDFALGICCPSTTHPPTPLLPPSTSLSPLPTPMKVSDWFPPESHLARKAHVVVIKVIVVSGCLHRNLSRRSCSWHPNKSCEAVSQGQSIMCRALHEATVLVKANVFWISFPHILAIFIPLVFMKGMGIWVSCGMAAWPQVSGSRRWFTRGRENLQEWSFYPFLQKRKLIISWSRCHSGIQGTDVKLHCTWKPCRKADQHTHVLCGWQSWVSDSLMYPMGKSYMEPQQIPV